MSAADVFAALLKELVEVENLAVEAGLRLQAAGREPAGLPLALADARAAAECLRHLLARLPEAGGQLEESRP
jgi:hypothetical protein